MRKIVLCSTILLSLLFAGCDTSSLIPSGAIDKVKATVSVMADVVEKADTLEKCKGENMEIEMEFEGKADGCDISETFIGTATINEATVTINGTAKAVIMSAVVESDYNNTFDLTDNANQICLSRLDKGQAIKTLTNNMNEDGSITITFTELATLCNTTVDDIFTSIYMVYYEPDDKIINTPINVTISENSLVFEAKNSTNDKSLNLMWKITYNF